MSRSTRICLVILAGLLLVVQSRPIGAAPKAGGTTISPALQQLVLDGDQPKLDASLTVINNSDQPASYELAIIDMGALDETGGLVFSGLRQDYQQRYGLAKWASLPQTRLTIGPHVSQKVGFSITNDPSLSPGGHYGAITVRQTEQPGNASARVTISPELVSLIFFNKKGGERYQLSLDRIDAQTSLWHLPSSVSLSFKNEGNVHLVPRGVVRIKNSFGKEVARGIINPDSSIILPERNRNLQVELQKETKFVWPGRYTIEAEYRYDGQTDTERRTTDFYSTNAALLGGVLSFIVLIGVIGRLAWGYRRRWRKSLTKFKKIINKKFR